MRSASFLISAILLHLITVPVHAQWTPRSSGTTVELRGVSVVSPSVAWASGQKGTVLRTTDGGGTWAVATVAGAETLDLRAIAAISARTAFVMSIGDSSRIYRTTDGGHTWSLRFVSTRKGSFLDAIRFWDTRRGIAVSDPVDGRFLVVTTTDGGETWQEAPAEGMPPALPGEGAFAASGSCLAAQGHGHAWFVTGGAAIARVFHSTDYGRHWRAWDSPIRAGAASAGIFSAVFRDGLHGVISGGDYAKAGLGGRNVAITSNGGRSWTLVDSSAAPQGFRSAVEFVPGTRGRELVAVGLNGTDRSHDGGLTWAATDSVAYNALQFGGRTGFVVGPKGRIATAALMGPAHRR